MLLVLTDRWLVVNAASIEVKDQYFSAVDSVSSTLGDEAIDG